MKDANVSSHIGVMGFLVAGYRVGVVQSLIAVAGSLRSLHLAAEAWCLVELESPHHQWNHLSLQGKYTHKQYFRS